MTPSEAASVRANPRWPLIAGILATGIHAILMPFTRAAWQSTPILFEGGAYGQLLAFVVFLLAAAVLGLRTILVPTSRRLAQVGTALAWLGLAAALGGIVSEYWYPQAPAPGLFVESPAMPPWFAVAVLGLVAAPFVLGVASTRERLAAWWSMPVFVAMAALTWFGEASVPGPYIVWWPPLTVGTVLLGLAALRSGSLPWWAGWSLIVGALITWPLGWVEIGGDIAGWTFGATVGIGLACFAAHGRAGKSSPSGRYL
jgi:hypothetical protein